MLISYIAQVVQLLIFTEVYLVTAINKKKMLYLELCFMGRNDLNLPRGISTEYPKHMFCGEIRKISIQ